MQVPKKKPQHAPAITSTPGRLLVQEPSKLPRDSRDTAREPGEATRGNRDNNRTRGYQETMEDNNHPARAAIRETRGGPETASDNNRRGQGATRATNRDNNRRTRGYQGNRDQ